MTTRTIALWALIAFYFGSITGYAKAHQEVQLECDRLGAFYVNEIVFDCKRKDLK